MSDAKITIRRATHADLPFLVAAGKRETETIGFLPTAALREYISRRNVLVALSDGTVWPAGQPIGFLVWRLSHGKRPAHRLLPTGRHLKIIQLCVVPRFRRQGIGSLLVRQLIRVGERRRAGFISCWVAAELEAVRFWFEGAGFDSPPGMVRAGGGKRGRVHQLFVSPNLRRSRGNSTSRTEAAR